LNVKKKINDFQNLKKAIYICQYAASRNLSPMSAGLSNFQLSSLNTTMNYWWYIEVVKFHVVVHQQKV
jgi:hypothetical protein